jgi:hypothetical protein
VYLLSLSFHIKHECVQIFFFKNSTFERDWVFIALEDIVINQLMIIIIHETNNITYRVKKYLSNPDIYLSEII